MNPFLRFGLPPGGALILVALVEVFNPIMTMYIDWVGVLVRHDMGEDLGLWEYFWLGIIVLEILITAILLIYGVVLKGKKAWLLYWMGACSVFLLIFILIEIIVSLQVFFMEWSVQEIGNSLNSIYIILMTTAIFAYEVHLGIHCLSFFNTIADLEPIGKGWRFIYEFYKTHAKEAASLILMFEIVLNTQIFLDRQMTRFVFGHEFLGYEGDNNFAVITEETFIRYVRIALASVGFFIAYKDKKYWMYRFCVCYLVTIAISAGIFIYLLFMWRAEHVILTLLYFSISFINLVYRMWVLFTCVKYTDVFERSGIPM